MQKFKYTFIATTERFKGLKPPVIKLTPAASLPPLLEEVRPDHPLLPAAVRCVQLAPESEDV